MKVEIESTSHAGTTISTQLAQNARDYSKAAYASLLQVPDSEQAIQLGEALGELLFPEEVERGRGRPPDRKARVQAALAFVADILETIKREQDRQVY